jgi:hypothetical protein
MSPVSDIGAFRNGRWRLEGFLRVVRLGLEWAIDHRAVYDFLGHPSCLYDSSFGLFWRRPVAVELLPSAA